VRRTRLNQLAILAAVITAVVIAGCGGAVRGTPKPSAGSAKEPRAAVAALLAGIPQRGSTLGDPNAPVTLEYFGDLQCPYCKQFTLAVLPSLIKSYVRSGKLKIEYRSLESATRDRETFAVQQVAALAAGTQNRLWPFIELFYYEQGREDSGYVTERYLQGLAQQVGGLNLPAWSAARSDAALLHTITRDARIAYYARFRGTPSFLIGKPGGRLWTFNPGTLTQVSPYAAAIGELLRFGHPQGLGAPRASSTIGLAGSAPGPGGARSLSIGQI
jgi:protein-disulfide isomerase